MSIAYAESVVSDLDYYPLEEVASTEGMLDEADVLSITNDSPIAELGDLSVQEAVSVLPVASDEQSSITPKRRLKVEDWLRNQPQQADSDIITSMLANMSRYPVLSHEEHLALARTVRKGQTAAAELRDLKHTSADRFTQLYDWVQEGEAAKERFALSNLRLVVRFARPYLPALAGQQTLALEDLLQFGNDGLLRAVDKFDPDKGFKFSTYAAFWIRQKIQRGISQSRHTIHIPEDVRRIAMNIEELESQGLSSEEIRQLTGLTEAKQEDLRLSNIAANMLSLDDRLGDHKDDAAVGDRIADSAAEAEYTNFESKEAVEDLLTHLDNRSATILRMQFGISPYPYALSVQEVADELGLTASRVGQLRRGALAGLQLAVACEQLVDEAALSPYDSKVLISYVASSKPTAVDDLTLSTIRRLSAKHHPSAVRRVIEEATDNTLMRRFISGLFGLEDTIVASKQYQTDALQAALVTCFTTLARS